ncbi:MAG: hypothetical protein IT177_11620 [Acidobacteria bacterium]|nr:hypothetical protein [Acidobacteriota bacterium]
MTRAEALAHVDQILDRTEADSRRRFLSDVLADAPGLDVDQLDALLDANATEWARTRREAHALIRRAFTEDRR